MQPDGSPARRDPVFLQETGIVPCAGRLMGPSGGRTLVKTPSFGYVRGPGDSNTIGAVGGLTSSSVDPAVPITMYTEAAAKSNYTGTFYVSEADLVQLQQPMGLRPAAQQQLRSQASLSTSYCHCTLPQAGHCVTAIAPTSLIISVFVMRRVLSWHVSLQPGTPWQALLAYDMT